MISLVNSAPSHLKLEQCGVNLAPAEYNTVKIAEGRAQISFNEKRGELCTRCARQCTSAEDLVIQNYTLMSMTNISLISKHKKRETRKYHMLHNFDATQTSNENMRKCITRVIWLCTWQLSLYFPGIAYPPLRRQLENSTYLPSENETEEDAQ